VVPRGRSGFMGRAEWAAAQGPPQFYDI